ncbi:hypothetical protein CYMTET_23792 [Cymbomonas tetramitiformis]|uniref:Small RNA 2'-O-methyltransferase n=1 Tax=Cymbomonas tetramitiformis TaxID=36881 RepID=A0AAE0L0J8_9CHLO|nr:hypothetical protein CYMTET_23792 [Cymbomonas tetramitiformis]
MSLRVGEEAEVLQEWADHLARSHGYEVEYSGVGRVAGDHRGPLGHRVGFATQIATFRRRASHPLESLGGTVTTSNAPTAADTADSANVDCKGGAHARVEGDEGALMTIWDSEVTADDSAQGAGVDVGAVHASDPRNGQYFICTPCHIIGYSSRYQMKLRIENRNQS